MVCRPLGTLVFELLEILNPDPFKEFYKTIVRTNAQAKLSTKVPSYIKVHVGIT